MSSVTAFRIAWLISLGLAGAMGLVMWLGWAGNEAERIDWFGHAWLLMIGMAALFGVGELIAGPLRKITLKAGPVELNIDGDDASENPE